MPRAGCRRNPPYPKVLRPVPAQPPLASGPARRPATSPGGRAPWAPGGGRVRGCLGQREILHADAGFFRPFAFRVLLQEGLIGFLRIGVARLLPIALLVELLDARLGLRREFAARIFLQEFFIGIRGVRRPGFFPVALLAAAAADAEQQRQTDAEDRFVLDHFHARGGLRWRMYSTSIGNVAATPSSSHHARPWMG